MKALSIREPWASMIARGEKTIEIRTWRTRHRGPLLLCAAKSSPGPLAGKAFAIANLVSVRKMQARDRQKACADFFPNAYAWIFEDIYPVDNFSVCGRPGLFDVAC